MKDKTNKPCDDIFEGLAELLMDNGRITSVYRKTIAVGCTHTSKYTYEHLSIYTIEYGVYEYTITMTDHKLDSIKRYVRESEDE